MTAVRRSTGPRPEGTNGERASGMTTKILSRWSGGYQDKYGCTRKGGGGGQKRDEHHRNLEGNRAFYKQARYPGDDLRRAEGLMTSAGGAVSWAPHESRGNLGVRGRHDTRATPGNETRDSRNFAGYRRSS